MIEEYLIWLLRFWAGIALYPLMFLGFFGLLLYVILLCVYVIAFIRHCRECFSHALIFYVVFPAVIIIFPLIFAILGAKSYQPAPPAFSGESTALSQTQIVPTLDAPVEANKNILWCASINAAWSQLRALAGEEVIVTDAEDLCERLNAVPDPAAYVPDDAMYAAAGFVDEGILSRIHQEFTEKFPDRPAPEFPGIAPESFLAYACLDAALPFGVPYYENEEAFTFHDGTNKQTRIRSFCSIDPSRDGNPDLSNQVAVLYTGTDSGIPSLEDVSTESSQPPPEKPVYIIDLDKDSSPCQLVVAMVPFQENLDKTYRYALDCCAETAHLDYSFSLTDELIVPNIAFKILHHFTALEGNSFVNESLRQQRIDVAMQETSFRLDRSGAELLSISTAFQKSSSEHYHFNRPFLLYMKMRDAEEPFFVLWVDNAELLEKWE